MMTFESKTTLGLIEEVEPSVYHLLKTKMQGESADLSAIVIETKSELLIGDPPILMSAVFDPEQET